MKNFIPVGNTRPGRRVESENRVNKTIGGPKKTLPRLFRGLNELTNDQKVQDLIRQRQAAACGELRNFVSSDNQDHKCRREMDESVFYTAEVIQLRSGKRQWDEYAFEIQQERGYTWGNN
ncbi:hypothetical protein B0H13DRAFT_1861615 [Mycena leptocephala]|nr:hypothetical protein B0H13DRAFT_1861615 [Mycena leptocephala]